MPYDFNAAGSYIKTEPYARKVRDKIGDTFVAIPGTIQENTEASFQANKEAFKAEILTDLEPTAVAAEVVTAREGYASLDARLDAIGNKVLLGTSSTGVNTAIKAVTLANFVLYTGVRIAVKFTNGCNTVTGLGLNVDSKGTKGIQLRGANLTSTDQAWQAGDTVPFVYDGSYWQMEDNSSLSKIITRVPVGSMVQQGVTNFFKPTSDQALVASTPATIALAKEVGDLSIATNLITLQKGFYYKCRYGLGAYGASHTGAVQAKVVKSDGSVVGNLSTAKGRSVTGTWGEHGNAQGVCLIDLTSAGADIQIKYLAEIVETNCALDRFNTYLEIEKYVKSV